MENPYKEFAETVYETITGEKIQDVKFGQVVLFEIDYEKRTITEIGRTRVMPFGDALDAYANIPNPPSQLLRWSTEEEHAAAEAELQSNIRNSDWLEELISCI